MAKRLFVGNLAFTTTEQDLREAFSKAGTCESATVMMDRETGRSRGFGFVDMATDEDATRAISSLNGTDVGGRAINVTEARERGAARPPGGGGGGGYSRYNTPPPFEGNRWGGGSPPRKEGGSRRGLRGRKRSL